MLHCCIEAHSRVRFFGGGGAVLLHCGSFSRPFLPLPKGEPEGVLITQRVLPLSKGELEGVQS